MVDESICQKARIGKKEKKGRTSGVWSPLLARTLTSLVYSLTRACPLMQVPFFFFFLFSFPFLRFLPLFLAFLFFTFFHLRVCFACCGVSVYFLPHLRFVSFPSSFSGVGLVEFSSIGDLGTRKRLLKRNNTEGFPFATGDSERWKETTVFVW